MKRLGVLGCVVVAVASGAMSGVAVAGKDKPPTKAKAEKTKAAEQPPVVEAEPAPDSNAAPAEPEIPHISGPKQIDLGHHAQIDLPAGMALIEAAPAQALMRKWGNSPEGVIAVIFPESQAANWWVSIEASDDGYVSDDDADELDASSLLEQIKQATLQQNKTRVAIGVPEFIVDDWSERPSYQRAQHHLVWGIIGHEARGQTVNFATRFLGRNGYLSVDLVVDAATIEQAKGEALAILTAVHFAPGFRYEDHASGDRDSGIGLKTLVLGGTAVVLAKKGGILIAILLGLKKGIVVIALAIGAFFKRLFGRKKRDEGSYEGSYAASTTPSAGPPPPDDDPSRYAPPSDPPSDPPAG